MLRIEKSLLKKKKSINCLRLETWSNNSNIWQTLHWKWNYDWVYLLEGFHNHLCGKNSHHSSSADLKWTKEIILQLLMTKQIPIQTHEASLCRWFHRGPRALSMQKVELSRAIWRQSSCLSKVTTIFSTTLKGNKKQFPTALSRFRTQIGPKNKNSIVKIKSLPRKTWQLWRQILMNSWIVRMYTMSC